MDSVTRKVRDVYAKRLYAAEDQVSRGRSFDSIVDCQQFVSTVQSVDTLFAGRPWVSVKKAHGNAKSSWICYEENIVSLLPEHMNEQVILHELSHIVTPRDVQWHGKEFCWNYLDLTMRWRGPSVYLDLRNAIRAQGIPL